MKGSMSLIGKFAQPDSSPTYFIDFLDRQEDIRNLRAKAASRMKLAAGQRALDLGCGIGGATFPLAEITGPAGLAAGVDISTAMVEAATKRVGSRPGIEFKVGEACAIPYPGDFFDAAADASGVVERG
jgi:ubiquinone/menaquinone biosynthesis C-methylase UbiE